MTNSWIVLPAAARELTASGKRDYEDNGRQDDGAAGLTAAFFWPVMIGHLSHIFAEGAISLPLIGTQGPKAPHA